MLGFPKILNSYYDLMNINLVLKSARGKFEISLSTHDNYTRIFIWKNFADGSFWVPVAISI